MGILDLIMRKRRSKAKQPNDGNDKSAIDPSGSIPAPNVTSLLTKSHGTSPASHAITERGFNDGHRLTQQRRQQCQHSPKPGHDRGSSSSPPGEDVATISGKYARLPDDSTHSPSSASTDPDLQAEPQSSADASQQKQTNGMSSAMLCESPQGMEEMPFPPPQQLRRSAMLRRRKAFYHHPGSTLEAQVMDVIRWPLLGSEDDGEEYSDVDDYINEEEEEEENDEDPPWPPAPSSLHVHH
ncbi:hypothetical protein AB5N19_09284 [Seiridium cardinale]|uniref:Uncharacterized protein n=1 Tax=Seiridium cardinale TaxID=138064 RepID=A0ABR2Y7J1_9PEZI